MSPSSRSELLKLSEAERIQLARARSYSPSSCLQSPMRYTRSSTATLTSEYGSVPGTPLTTSPASH